MNEKQEKIFHFVIIKLTQILRKESKTWRFLISKYELFEMYFVKEFGGHKQNRILRSRVLNRSAQYVNIDSPFVRRKYGKIHRNPKIGLYSLFTKLFILFFFILLCKNELYLFKNLNKLNKYRSKSYSVTPSNI